MTRPASPYLVPGFYDRALAAGRHREITGGWWDETGRIQMDLLRGQGMQPHHRLLDIGAGALRLGRLAVPYLDPGNYWATDASGALMRRGHGSELADPGRLRDDHLIEDADFAFPGVPATIDYAMAFAVFTHLPDSMLSPALTSLRTRCPTLTCLLLTVFLANAGQATPLRQAHGVVTHHDRPPYHRTADAVLQDFAKAGFVTTLHDTRLPRGQALIAARPV